MLHEQKAGICGEKAAAPSPIGTPGWLVAAEVLLPEDGCEACLMKSSHAQAGFIKDAGSFESFHAAGNAAKEKIIAENDVSESAAVEDDTRKFDAENASGKFAVSGVEMTINIL